MRTLAAGILLLSICAVLTAQLPVSQDVPFAISVEVPLVNVDFTVADTSGKPVTDLNRYDFEVLDNGKPRPIQNFSPVRTPYNLVLLLDCSRSTYDRVNMLVSAMARLADELRPQDKVAIATFGTEIIVVVDWNGTQTPVNTVDSPACHGTNFYAAMAWAEKKLRGTTGRRGVVVFSDGQESDVARRNVKVDGIEIRQIVPPAQDQEFQKVLKVMHDSSIPYYFIAIDTDMNPGKTYSGPLPDLQQVRARLEQMADKTGGRIVYPQSTADVVPLILQISRDLGISYSLGFTPQKDSSRKPHQIEIRVRGESYVVKPNKTAYVPE